MFRCVMIVFVVSILSFAPVLASENCDNPQTQTDMNICSSIAYTEADKELNVTYQKALGILKDIAPSKVENFKKIQRAWVEFRDLNCKFARDGYEGGTIAPLIFATCMKELTEQRTKQIPDFFQEWGSLEE